MSASVLCRAEHRQVRAAVLHLDADGGAGLDDPHLDRTAAVQQRVGEQLRHDEPDVLDDGRRPVPHGRSSSLAGARYRVHPVADRQLHEADLHRTSATQPARTKRWIIARRPAAPQQAIRAGALRRATPRLAARAWEARSVTTTSALLGFALVAGLLTITPGLDTALVLRAALTQDRTRAYATAAGICGGVLVWGVAAAVGISALLAASTLAYDALRVVGAAYMVWLGVRLLLAARRGAPHGPDAVPAAATAWQGLRRGLLTNLLNPKIGAFYIAVLPQFLPEDVSAVAMGALLAAAHVALSLLWFSVLILAAGRMRGLLRRPAAQQALDGGTGLVLVGFGLRLGLSR